MFRTKICGVTNVEDARMVADVGADALGLNFYPPSKRYVDVETARRIADAVGDQLLCVGVFVNTPVDELRQIAAEANLSAIQLHGDEPPETVAQLGEALVILAKRFNGEAAAIAGDIDRCQTAGRKPDAVLVDAPAAGQFGGAGETFSWGEFAGMDGHLCELPLILAGGLNPQNVAEAIQIVGPWGVDVASGVESSPGRKDKAACQQFVRVARSLLEKPGK